MSHEKIYNHLTYFLTVVRSVKDLNCTIDRSNNDDDDNAKAVAQSKPRKRGKLVTGNGNPNF